MKTIASRAVKLIDVRVGHRLRQTNLSSVEMFIHSFAENGQQQPIELMKIHGNLVLLDGAHRLAAARKLKWSKIDAVIKVPSTDNPEIEARLHEIDANLLRRDLVGLERMAFLAARKNVYLTQHPEAGRGGDRRSKKAKKNQSANIALWSFSKVTADEIGLGERTIKAAIATYNALTMDTRARLQGQKLAQNDAALHQLSKLSADTQSKVLDLLLAVDPKFKSISEALAHLDGKTPESETDKYYKSATGNLNRLTPTRRKDVFRNYADEIRVLAREEGWI